MKKSKLNFLKEGEALFYDTFNFYIENFSTEVFSKIIFDSPDLNWIETTLNNSILHKRIILILSEGVNVDQEQFYSINISIANFIDHSQIKSFSIKDYAFSRTLKIISKDFFINESDFFRKAHLYFTEVIDILKTAEIQKILFTEYWIDIKPDFSPYK